MQKSYARLSCGLGLALICGCTGEPADEAGDTFEAPSDAPALRETGSAVARLSELRRSFPVLSTGSPTQFRVRKDGAFTASLGHARPFAKITLPAVANGWAEVEDTRSSLAIRFARSKGDKLPFGVAGGIGLYVDEERYMDTLFRVTSRGAEDFVRFASRPAVEELTYTVDVTLVAGLRLVSNTLEFLDASGTPRLRVAPPYVFDTEGARHAATLSLDGCEYDDDPSAPWGRPVVPPLAPTCTVRVAWSATKYPVLVDPSWSATIDMTVARQSGAAARLGSGHVLVVGGYADAAGGVLDSSEIYDPDTATFAAAEKMSVPRGTPTAGPLPSGKVLVVGGHNGGPCCAQSSWSYTGEAYDEATGHWTVTLNSMQNARQGHTQTLLASGKVLVAGGGAGPYWSTADVYDPATNRFAKTGDLAWGIRATHAATLLSTGQVLITGGQNQANAELYDPQAGTFSKTGNMLGERGGHAAVSLGSGKAVLVGGNGHDGTPPLKTAEIYDVSTGNFSATSGSMKTGRNLVTATVLESGLVLAVGGTSDQTAGLASAELFDPVKTTFSDAPSMKVARVRHVATQLENGSVLITGGLTSTAGSTPSVGVAEVFEYRSNGEGCTASKECASTFCADGVCCESLCDGQCEACGETGKKGQCVAVTGEPRKPRDACTSDRGCSQLCDGKVRDMCVSPSSCDTPDGGGGASGGGGMSSLGSGGAISGGAGASAGSTMSGGAPNSGGAAGTQGPGGSKAVESGAGGSSSTQSGGASADGGELGGSCTTNDDCSGDQFCKKGACVPRTELESACGCRVPGRRTPSRRPAAPALLLGLGALLFRRTQPSARADRS